MHRAGPSCSCTPVQKTHTRRTLSRELSEAVFAVAVPVTVDSCRLSFSMTPEAIVDLNTSEVLIEWHFKQQYSLK